MGVGFGAGRAVRNAKLSDREGSGAVLRKPCDTLNRTFGPLLPDPLGWDTGPADGRSGYMVVIPLKEDPPGMVLGTGAADRPLIEGISAKMAGMPD
jgi:hypothetical protein